MEAIQSDMELSRQSGKSQQPRKRKKQYYNRIRHQMEFYFGDANLSKDRFINKLLAVNPYVPLDVFMTFNKIKELANGVDELQKAIESSEMLELSSDRQSVRRTTEIKKKEDIDEYMVYVEALPSSATHESIKQQFKQFGNVAYVSLPKYRTSGRIKEFAFVEFEDKSSVEKCINAFRQFDGVIADAQDAENLTSVVSYVKEQEDLENNTDKQEQSDEDDEDKVNIKKENEVNAKKEIENEAESSSNTKDIKKEECGTKRPKKESATSDSDETPPVKRVKLDESEREVEAKGDAEAEGEVEDKGDGDGEADTEHDLEQEKDSHDNTDEKASITDDNQDHKKKRRRRGKRNPSTAATINDSGFGANVVDEVKTTDDPNQALSTLRVATKVEWKRLRNKYLMLQRQKYAEVKKLLQQKKHGDNRKVSTLPLSTVRPVTMKNKKNASPPSKKICTRNINFYGAMRDEKNTYECSIIDENKPNADKLNEKESKNEKQFGKDLQFEFEPGLIVKVNFEAPCTDTVDFKAEMKQYAFVRYIDIKEGQTYAYVRVDSPRSAPVLIKHCAPNRCQILTGESETDYWSKIAKDREQKLSKKVKVPKVRSRKMRNIIKNIAEINVVKGLDNKTSVNHIRFDDD